MELDQQRIVNPANEITSIDQGQGQAGWITPEFDAAGNMILGPRADAPGTAQFYVYDAWNRLAKVFADTDENGEFDEEEDELVAEYRYDGRNRRVEKILTEASGEPGSVAYYHNHAWQVLEERVFDDEQEVERVYQNVWSPRYIDALILRDACDPAMGAILLPERLFYLADANYNVTGVVRENPTSPGEWHVVERYVYDPYGRVVVLNGDPAGDPDGLAAPEVYPEWSADPDGRSDRANTTLYTGRALDPESGLMYYRARYYDAGLGAFISRDPAKADPNLYRYVRNNPVIYVDPSGNWGEDVHYDRTKQWAMAAGFTEQAAEDIAAADKNTDGLIGGTAPLPMFGDQDYHFNGNRRGVDTRDTILGAYIAHAKKLASQTPTPGNLIKVRVIAVDVGIALHAKQDWVAHADYGYRVPKGQDIWIIHNSRSPQKAFGDPGNYPDDPTLDVIGSPDGRATKPYLWATWGWSWFHIQDAEYACYKKGTKRIELTEKITKQILGDFRRFLEGNTATADARNYFLGR